MRLPDVDRIFDWCVDVLIYWAKVFGITYNEINVYIFCVIWPIVTIGLVVFCVGLWNSNRKLKAKFYENGSPRK